MTPKTYLTPADKARIQRERDSIRQRLRATADAPVGTVGYMKPSEVPIDEGKLRAREQHLTHVLETESAPRVGPLKKNEAYREFQGLVREWESHAMTKQEQGYGYPELMKKRVGSEEDFERAKAHCAGWEMASRGRFVGARLKELAAHIDPDNPQLRNLENFRRRQ